MEHICELVPLRPRGKATALVERDRTKKPWFHRNRNKQMDRIVYCDGDPSLEVVPFEQT